MAICFILLLLFIKMKTKYTLFDSWMRAASIWTAAMFLGTELLSVGENIFRWSVFLFWTSIDVILLIIIIKGVINKKSKVIFPAFKRVIYYVKSRTLSDVLFLLIFLIAFVIALLTVPYNWDFMTYHLPRIAHWAQNGTVAHYATNIIRQIGSPVLSEFVNLHVYVLSGNRDNLFNLLQFFSFFTNTVIIYKISEKLQVDKKYAKIAALLFISMPIAFGEALTTQVDQFATLWLLIFVYEILDFFNLKEKIEWNSICFFGTAFDARSIKKYSYLWKCNTAYCRCTPISGNSGFKISFYQRIKKLYFQLA